MRIEDLKAAESEAHRFLSAVQAAKERLKDVPGLFVFPSKEGGAVRRASLDLTRALATLRRSG